jgi:DNA-binding transcriptional LysR family regulator
MRRLEGELGVQLLERHSRGVDLTAAGELFLERARAVLTAAEAAGATGRDLKRGVVGSVSLGITTCARWHQTSALLRRFVSERAGVELTALEGYGGTLWRELCDGRLDAVIAPASFASAKLSRLELGAEPWAALVGHGHPLAGSGPLRAQDLEGERITATAHRDGAGHDRDVASLLDELGVRATLVRSAPGPALYRSVAQADAVALTTAPEALPAGVLVRPLTPVRTLPFALLWRQEVPSPALTEFLTVATESLRPATATRATVAAVA